MNNTSDGNFFTLKFRLICAENLNSNLVRRIRSLTFKLGIVVPRCLGSRHWPKLTPKFRMIWIRISDPRTLGKWSIKWTPQILVQSGIIGSFDLPWSERSRITDPDTDHLKGNSIYKKKCLLFHDAAMLAESGLYNSLRVHAVSTTGQPMCIYGDPAYPIRMYLQGPFRQRPLTPLQGSMSAARCSVEWLFSDIVNDFKFLDFKRNLKIGLSQVGKMYIVCAILQNVLICLYGNTTVFWPRSTFSRGLFFLITPFCNHPT